MCFNLWNSDVEVWKDMKKKIFGCRILCGSYILIRGVYILFVFGVFVIFLYKEICKYRVVCF